MNLIKEIHKSDIPALGTPIGGGFAVAMYRDGDKQYLLVDAGKAGELRGEYGFFGTEIEGARSCTDGLANTIDMAEAGSALAKAALALRIEGYDDWHIPARDQQELQYRYLKPGTQENWCSFRDGENPSALPLATYAYTKENPPQTAIEAYRSGGEHAFGEQWYWASTQSSARYAWIQDFASGYQDCYYKYDEFAVRAVRRILIIQ